MMKKGGNFHPLWLRIRPKEVFWIITIVVLLSAAIAIFHVIGERTATLPPGDNSKLSQGLPVFEPKQLSGFFPAYRLDRERIRGQQLEILKSIMENEDSDDKIREMALSRMVKITEEMDREMRLEGLVKSEGVKECVALTQGEKATLIIPAGVLSPERLEEMRKSLLDFMELSEDKIWLKEAEKE